MRIVNTVKVKEEFDYESLCRKLENQVDNLTADIERQQKLRDDDKYELEKQLRECQENFAEANKILVTRSAEVGCLSCPYVVAIFFGWNLLHYWLVKYRSLMSSNMLTFSHILII